jgi:membrane-associated protease RseP (regulator of RpoE activity)
MVRQALALVTALALGGFAGFWLARTDITPPVPAKEAAQADALAHLQHDLAGSEQERARLQQQISRLEARLTARTETTAPQETEVPDENPATPAQEATPRNHINRTSFENLIAAGIPEMVATDIQARLDKWQWERLQLQDRARREGWFNSARYRRETHALQPEYESLRTEIGDDNYDRLLYALGRSNRVRVRDVIQFSAAAQAGLQAGDRIVEYGGQRVFSTGELNALTAEDSAGAPVLARVERDGERLDVYLPRGPIGVRIIHDRVAP